MTDLNKIKEWALYWSRSAVAPMLIEEFSDASGTPMEDAEVMFGAAKLVELIDRLEAAEKRVAAMEYSDYLQWHAMACKNGERAEKAEAELARRDAAAGEPVAEIKWDGTDLTVQNVKDGFSFGVTKVYSAPQPAALPPEVTEQDAPLGCSAHGANCWMVGANWMRERTKALGCQPPKEFVVNMPDVEKWRRAQGAYRVLVEKEIKAAGWSIADE